MGHIALADAIEALRAELETARAAGDGQALRFELGTVDLELQATVTTDADVKIGIKWWLLEAGAAGSASRATTQTVKLSLTPRLTDREGHTSTVFLDDAD